VGGRSAATVIFNIIFLAACAKAKRYGAKWDMSAVEIRLASFLKLRNYVQFNNIRWF